MPILYLLRHTKPDVPQGICYGQTDVPLAASFIEEVAHVKAKIMPCIEHRSVQIISSPLQRCLRLAEAISQNAQDIVVDRRLQEMNFGAWEMHPWGSIDRFVMNAWMRDFVHVAPPLGESFIALVQRVWEALYDILRSTHPSADIVLVIHAGVIRAIIARILEIPLAKAFMLELEYGSLS
ncbi:MAG: alpha-ribazole phosphatase, partial [Bacteroidota bacterium]|nr:alpha-ribazole phosphatase [Candidatus Kapabacteria bacterium]MDW8220987.1 alpha-ribazole phosphatase [Bacteroidota bacterium]